MTATPIKGRLELKKQIAVTMRAECNFFWKCSLAVRQAQKPWDALDNELNVALTRGQLSPWLREQLEHLRELNAHRAGIQ